MSKALRFLCLSLVFCLFFPLAADAAPLEEVCPLSLTAPSALLMEAHTGTVIFEKNAGERRPAASITKLMSLLLVLDAVEAGRISLTDSITVSQTAARQTGSQAFLDAGAAYTVETLLRATIIASANDAAVALAEHLHGSEDAFAVEMNQRARQMGLQNTFFVNCTGLPAQGQYTCAADVAQLARAVCAHPTYFRFSSVWMDTLTHPSGRVTDLVNTNRLVRFYSGCDGLKTGSTNEAKYCLCATAEKDGMRLIAVVLGVPNSQTRFDEARQMMDWGFANYAQEDICQAGDLLGIQLPVHLGSRDQVDIVLGTGLSMLLRPGDKAGLSFEVSLPENITAPVEKGQKVGQVHILLHGAVIATLPAVTGAAVPLPGMLHGIMHLLENWK